MRISISASSSDLIDEKYKEESSKLLEFLANEDCELNWGSGTNSIMGICYEQFSKKNKNIYGYTTEKYKDMINELPNAIHNIFPTTFDLRKNMFNDADMIICLPGGTGTIAEVFSYLEEMRSNDVIKPFIIYNIDRHFNNMLYLINDLVKRCFNNETIYSFFKVINSLEEFKIFYKESC